MSAPLRQIIHLDMDAFYASVEQRENPALRDLPVIVGGSRERGVVCACSYPTRTLGVHSGMAMAQALQRCPEAVVLPVRMDLYREVSREVFTIFRRYTDLVEPLSVDEAFLDIGGSLRLHGPARQIAGRIRAEVRQELHLPVSAGIAPNKFLAKLASAAAKPDGLLEVEPTGVEAFLLPLPVERIWGIGKIATARLHDRGIRRIADLRKQSRTDLEGLFGRTGSQLFRLARGEDDRPVIPELRAKSIGAEETFAADLSSPVELGRQLLALVERAGGRLRRKRLCCGQMMVKVKFANFRSLTRSITLSQPTDRSEVLWSQAQELLARTDAAAVPVRLLGVSLGQLQPADQVDQADLFNVAEVERQRALDQAVDSLRERFGSAGVQRASLLGRKGSVQGSQVLREDAE